MTEATPRLWWNESGVIHASNGKGGATHLAHCDDEEAAELIVLYVNQHDALIEALEYIEATSNQPRIYKRAQAALDAARKE